MTGFDVLLRVVPGAATVVQYGCHHDAADGTDDEHAGDSQPAGCVLDGAAATTHVGPDNRRIAGVAEDQADDHRKADRQNAGEDHLAQRRLSRDIDGSAVVRTRSSRHDAGVLAKLAAHFIDDRTGGVADGADGERAEEEDEHHPEEPAYEDIDVRQVDRDLGGERYLQAFLHPVQEGGEEQEGGQAGGGNRVALRQGLGRIADGVQPVRDLTSAGRRV